MAALAISFNQKINGIFLMQLICAVNAA